MPHTPAPLRNPATTKAAAALRTATAWVMALCCAAAMAQPCDQPVALPYQQAFSGMPSGAPGQCITTVNVSGAPDGAWAVASPSGMYFTAPVAQAGSFDEGPYDAWLFLPPVQLSTSEVYRLSYKYGTNSGSSGSNNQGRLSVWYGSSPEPSAMSQAIVDHGVFNTPAVQTSTDIVPASNGVWYIGFRSNPDPYTRGTLIDDIHFGLRPSCAEPVGLQALGAGFDDVQLTWNCTGCTGPFVVEYGPASVFTVPGSGATAGAYGTIATVNAQSPYTLSGLGMGENYRVFVRQVCGATYGNNSAGVTFSTALGNTLCGTAAELPCGDVIDGATHQAFSWSDVSNYCQQSVFASKGVWYQVEGNGGEFSVSTSPAHGGWTVGDPNMMLFTGNCGDLDCVAYAPWNAEEQGSTIAWVSVPGEQYSLYVYGDAVSFRLAATCADPPTCFPPSALSLLSVGTQTAQFSWVASAAPQYGYEVRSAGAPGSGPTGLAASGTVGASPLTVNGLQPGTAYTLYVRGVCAGNDPSLWTSVEFPTLCEAADVPYDGGFQQEDIPVCYRVLDANADGTWYAAPRPSGGYADAFVARYGVAPGAAMADDWLITQGVNTVAGSTYRIIYKYSVISAVYPERFSVRMGNGALPAQLTTLLADHPVVTNNHNNVITDTVVVSPGTGVMYIGFHVTSESSGWQLCVGDVRVELVPTCVPPSGVVVSAIGTTGATLSWNAAAGAVGYAYEVRTSGAPGSGASGLAYSGTVTLPTAVLSGVLTASTVYQVYVRSDCGAINGTSVWGNGIGFNTSCPPTTVPFWEDFSGVSSGQLPLCFTKATPGVITPDGYGEWKVNASLSGLSFELPVVEVVTAEGGPFDAWLFTQGIELTGGVAYRLKYRYGTNSGSMGNNNQARLSVWLGNTASVAAMQQGIVDHGSFGGPVFDAQSDFTPASSGVWYIGFRSNNANDTWRTVLDDISLELAPTCMEPTEVEVLTGAGSTVQVQWECTDCPGNFIVEYGPASIYSAPGTGNDPGTNGTIASLDATAPLFITGLTSGENYRLFVRQVCAGDDFSLPSAPADFSTVLTNGYCGQAVPVVCGSSVLGATANAPEFPGSLNLCGFNPMGTFGVWYRITGTGGTYSLSTCEADGGYTIGEVDILVLEGQCNNFTCVAFAAAGSGACGGTRVEWQAQNGVQYHVQVMGEGASFRLAAACVPPPQCAAPNGLALTGLSPVHAQVNWTATAGGGYDHELRTSGAAGSGATGLVAQGSGAVNGPLLLEGLQPGTGYTLHLRKQCEGVGPSTWVSITFTTGCTTVDPPYDGGFTANEVPACYRVVDVAADGTTWTARPNTSGGYTDPFIAGIGVQPGVEKNDWLITRGINTVAGVSYRLSYKHSVISALYPERLSVYYGNAPVASAMTELLIDHGQVTNSVPQANGIVFTPGAGPLYIGFRAHSLASAWQLYLGDIRLTVEDACGVPALQAFSFAEGEVEAQWQCVGCTGTFYIEYGPQGFVPGTGAVAGEGTLVGPFTGGSALLQGLSGDLSALRFHLRRDCTADGTVFSVNSPAAQALVATAVACGPTLHRELCYGNNEDSYHHFVGDGSLVLRFTGGAPQTCCDHVYVYDGSSNTAPLLYSGNQLAGVEVGSSNPWNTITLRMVSDAGSSCADGNAPPLRWDVLCGTVSITEADAPPLRAYPNPAQDILHIATTGNTAGAMVVEVIDASGRVLLQRHIAPSTAPIALPVHEVPVGFHLLRLRHAAGVHVQPFIIAR